jgi:restriction endonuclease S subunit
LIVVNAHNYLEKSKRLYNNAETLLLETLGLSHFEPSAEPVNVKGFKESFLTTGRLDAEYYQKKYEDYLDFISSYQNGFEELQTSCNLKDSNFTPDEKTEYKYIELADIGKTGDITGCTTATGTELPSRARRKVNTNDVIISSIEGSLESCALVTDEYNNALCSTGFYVINSKKINSETLLVLFKSEPIQNILKQSCSGTILTAINKNEFQKIPVPLIDKAIQELIKTKLTESFQLKKQSEQLLETAKRAVEIAIEQNEEAALRYIEQAQRASI